MLQVSLLEEATAVNKQRRTLGEAATKHEKPLGATRQSENKSVRNDS